MYVSRFATTYDVKAILEWYDKTKISPKFQVKRTFYQRDNYSIYKILLKDFVYKQKPKFVVNKIATNQIMDLSFANISNYVDKAKEEALKCKFVIHDFQNNGILIYKNEHVKHLDAITSLWTEFVSKHQSVLVNNIEHIKEDYIETVLLHERYVCDFLILDGVNGDILHD